MTAADRGRGPGRFRFTLRSLMLAVPGAALACAVLARAWRALGPEGTIVLGLAAPLAALPVLTFTLFVVGILTELVAGRHRERLMRIQRSLIGMMVLDCYAVGGVMVLVLIGLVLSRL